MRMLVVWIALTHVVLGTRVDGAHLERDTSNINDTQPTYASTGRGVDYASQCQSRYFSYSAASSVWDSEHQRIETQTQYIGGSSVSTITYYADATTLCDGHARVLVSPAIATHSVTSTYGLGMPASPISLVPQTLNRIFPVPTPTCSIEATDCDVLYAAYSTSMSSWLKADPTDLEGPQITSPPMLPPCTNSSQVAGDRSFSKSFYGCGECTLYGDDVRLLYFPVPTTVSRDMCASTPSASMTYFHINDGAIDVYAGSAYGQGRASTSGAKTAKVGQNTFTSGTAYVSIGRVYAQDRCSKAVGTTVSDVIIAMHSESVLSLRNSQLHYQYFVSSSTQTGWPVSYADFNHPVPWSAWNGQAICECPDWGCGCDVIYENDYRPQLAIPAAVRQLDSRWAGCQNWYGGLYDPPLILESETSFLTPSPAVATTQTSFLTPSAVAAVATSEAEQISTSAAPASSHEAVATPTQAGTQSDEQASDDGPVPSAATKTQPANSGQDPRTRTIQFGGQPRTFTVMPGGAVIIGSQTLSVGGPAAQFGDGVYATVANKGLVFGYSTHLPPPTSPGPATVQMGSTLHTIQLGQQTDIVQIDSADVTSGGSTATLSGGEVIQWGADGLTLVSETTATAAYGDEPSGTDAAPTTSSSAPFGGSDPQPFTAGTSSTSKKSSGEGRVVVSLARLGSTVLLLVIGLILG